MMLLNVQGYFYNKNMGNHRKATINPTCNHVKLAICPFGYKMPLRLHSQHKYPQLSKTTDIKQRLQNNGPMTMCISP